MSCDTIVRDLAAFAPYLLSFLFGALLAWLYLMGYAPVDKMPTDPVTRHISLDEYERIWQAQMDDFEQMPGGAQGATPDMRRYCTDEELPECGHA